MAGLTPYEQIRAGQAELYFLHIPKTAGTSLYPLLEQHFSPQATCPFVGAHDLHEQPAERWCGYQLYHGHFGTGLRTKLERAPLTITMMRDPLALEISSIHHRMRDTGRYPHLPSSFDECVRLPEMRAAMGMTYPGYLVENYQQLSVDERIVAAKRTLDDCLFVGLTERFDDSVALLAYKMGWPPPGPMQRRNERPQTQRGEIAGDTLAVLHRGVAPYQAIYDYAVERLERDLAAMQSELLRSHHRARFAAQTPRRELLLRFDQPVQGNGWHDWDRSPLGEVLPMRWTGPGTESTLDLRLCSDRDLNLSVHIANAVTQDVVESLELTVNDVPVPLKLSSVGGRQVIATGKVKAATLQSCPDATRLCFRVAKTHSWHDLDPSSLDTCKRGVAFTQLLLAPS